MQTKIELFDSLKPLYYISRTLSINPYKIHKKNFEQLSTSDKIYGYLLMILIASTVPLLLILAIGYAKYDETDLSIIILVYISYTSDAILALLSIWLSIQKHPPLINEFFEKLLKIDKVLSALSTALYAKLRLKLFLETFFVTLAVLIMIVVDCSFWVQNTNSLYAAIVAYFCQFFMYYYKILIYIQIVTKIDMINERFGLVNRSLEKHVKRADQFSPIQEIYKGAVYEKFNLHQIFETHSSLCDLVTNVNDLHGFQIVAFIFSIIISILDLLNYAIILALSIMFKVHSDLSFDFKYADIGILFVMCLGAVVNYKIHLWL